ncbi:alpha/beta hydrolase [Myroides sp. LJL119]
MKQVRFKHKNWQVAGLMDFPNNFKQDKLYPAIVCGHPISSTKNQSAARLYASALAQAGFIVLSFDASHQGESVVEPMFLEDPATRVEDFRCAVDFLTTLAYVDKDNIGVLGICGAGGYAVNAAMTERRFKAIVTVVGVNYGRVMREGDFSSEQAIKTLELIAAQRTLQANGAEELITSYIPVDQQARAQAQLDDIDMVQAVDYYTTSRAQHILSPNKLLFSGLSSAMGFDAFHLTDQLLTQPLHIVIGDIPGCFGSYRDGFELFNKAKTNHKSLQVIPNVSHYDLYDKPMAIEKAMTQIIPFFTTFLK